MGASAKEKAFPMAEIYHSSVFPHEGSHSYALHLNPHAARELFTLANLTAQLIGKHWSDPTSWVDTALLP